MVRVTCFSLQVRREPPHNRVASKIDGWSPCACILFSIIQATVKVEWRLCIHSFHNVLARSIASAIACGALLYQPYCKGPKFGPKIGRARSWRPQPLSAKIREVKNEARKKWKIPEKEGLTKKQHSVLHRMNAVAVESGEDTSE